MGRHASYGDEQLKVKLQQIVTKYGSITVETLKQANKEDGENFPSYKMFERRFGGIKNIKKMLTTQAVPEVAPVEEKKQILS